MVFLGVFVSFLAVTMITYWLLMRKPAEERRSLEKRLTEALVTSVRTEDVDLHLLRNELMSEIPRLNQLLMRLAPALQVKLLVDQANLNITVMRLWMISAIIGFVSGAIAASFAGSLLLGGAVGLAMASLPFLYVLQVRRKRLNAFLALLPDSLELMSRGLAAGHAFNESLRMVAIEMPEPIAGEFNKTYEEQNLGLSYKLALRNLTTRVPLLDLRLCVTAILIQRETGGNLAEILEKVGATVRERFRIMEDLKTLTTSSRMSAWVLCALPLLIAVIVSVMNPDYMAVLWRDARGQKLVGLAAGMQVIGMLIIRKIMRIKI
ncbi:MAG TPA: type II secretion system F family protein [Blastocatellia bacterium]|nr:type II secretion system F family protein [Blastocatellia bacterium]